MILAAGRGERLRPLTDHTPKPLVAIAGQPLIAHQLRWLAAAGIHDIVINLHHLGDVIADALGDGAQLGVRIHYSREVTLLETGGGIVQALPWLATGPFVILNGDVWTDFPFARLPTSLATDLAHLVLTPTPVNRTDGDFGFDTGRVQRGAERPYVYCGISVLSPRLFAGAPAGPFSLRDLLFKAIAADRVSGEVWAGRWIDIGTPDQLEAVRRLPY
jgi:MurNAc alpha-1-phosphate uridylyltransferase